MNVRHNSIHLPSGPQVEIVEDLEQQDSATHALATLSKHHGVSPSHEKTHGRVESHEVDVAPLSGTYMKPC
jgi:hypothetical protein